jgi:magnesium chelatase accessory protein
MSDPLSFARDGADWPNRAASAFVEAAGLRWHVQRMGGGPVLLLAHGTGAATHSWRALLPLLAQRFDVVAPDLPGHGFTQAPAPHRLSLDGMARDLAALSTKLGIRPDIVVGHSAGAAILVRMALDGLIAPKLIVSLNGAFLPFGGLAAQIFSPLAKAMSLNPLAPRLFAWRGRNPEAVRRLLAGTGSVIDAEGERLYGKLVGNSAHVAAALQMMANWKLEPLVRDLPRLKPGLLLVTGSNDRAIPENVAVRVRQLVAQSRIETMPGLGHLAHEERPAAVAELIASAAHNAGAFALQHENVNID